MVKFLVSAVILHQQFHWVHCPGICVAAFHKPFGPHSPGALKYIWCIVRPCNLSARWGEALYWRGSNPDRERLSDVVRRLRLEPPGNKGTRFAVLTRMKTFSLFLLGIKSPPFETRGGSLNMVPLLQGICLLNPTQKFMLARSGIRTCQRDLCPMASTA